MDVNEFAGDIFEWNLYTLLNYIKYHYIQFILLILVFIIIYIVDYISNINALFYSIPSSITGISVTDNKSVISKKNKNTKKGKK
jgi:hypothetical protein